MEAGEGLTEEHNRRDTMGSGEVCVHLIILKTGKCITHIYK